MIARLVGADGARLWQGVQDAVLLRYGKPKLLEMRSAVRDRLNGNGLQLVSHDRLNLQVFKLAFKAAQLYARGKIRDEDVAEVDAPLMVRSGGVETSVVR